jgi:hypothetical protein
MVWQIKKPGNDLLSHRQAAVPSAKQGVDFRVERAPPAGAHSLSEGPVALPPRAGRVLRSKSSANGLLRRAVPFARVAFSLTRRLRAFRFARFRECGVFAYLAASHSGDLSPKKAEPSDDPIGMGYLTPFAKRPVTSRGNARHLSRGKVSSPGQLIFSAYKSWGGPSIIPRLL